MSHHRESRLRQAGLPTIPQVARYAVLLAILIALAAWRPPEPETVFTTPSLPACDVAASETLAANVYVDATLSMQGFINAGPATAYSRFIEALERAFVAGWPKSSIRFFRFGSKIDSLSGRGYLDALNPSFYQVPGIFERTEIDEVLKRASADSLSVIITDLYQHNSNVAAMVRALRDHTLAKGLGFAVVGLRSPFVGTVYDVTPKRLTFPWNRPRPFYAVIVGRQTDIVRYLAEIKRTLTGQSPMETVIVSPCVLAKPIRWSRAAQVTVTPPIRVNTAVVPRQDGSIGGFDMRRRDAVGTIAVTIPVSTIPDGPTISFDQLALELSGKIATRPRLFWGAASVAKADTSNFVGKLALASADRVEMTIQLPAFGAKPAGIYMFQARFFVPAGALVLPAWCSTWSVTAQDLEKMIAARNFDGGRTLNLFEFVSDAVTAMLNQARREVGRLDFYVAFDP